MLCHLELRDRRITEVAGLMGLTPVAVSSLAYRTREGLRLAYLDQTNRRRPWAGASASRSSNGSAGTWAAT